MRTLALALSAAGAALGQQSGLHPAGPHAREIKSLGAVFVILLGVIFLAVIVLAVMPVLRRHRGMEQEPLERKHRPSVRTERRLTWVVGTAAVFSVLVLFGLIVVSVSTGKTVSGPIVSGNNLVIEVTGNQWWWDIRYMNQDVSRIVQTANEIHIPVGRPVMIRGTSHDVIHSFWIPNLQGKRDLIPSHITSEWIQADQPGRFRGQCAEFCGLQHAHMAMWVVAEPESQFKAWIAHQLEPAANPTEAYALRGQKVFLDSACVLCHTIRGTNAAGLVGPDLTHFGSRLTIAAATLANNKGNLGGWISDPQNIKPGNHMATVPIKAEDLDPLLDYLESLR